jgi:hypothetical protein
MCVYDHFLIYEIRISSGTNLAGDDEESLGAREAMFEVVVSVILWRKQ